MHVFQLALVHALGQVNRTVDKVPIDLFPEAVRLFNAIGLLVKAVRYREGKFKKVAKEAAMSQTMPSMPNDTRAAGLITQGEEVIRCKFSIELFAQSPGQDAVYSKLLSPGDWQKYAELIAISQVITKNIFAVQTDRVGHGGETVLLVARAINELERGRFRVVNLEAGKIKAWDSKTKYSDLPMVMMTTSAELSAARAGTNKPLPLMSDVAREYAGRLLGELKHYFLVDGDALPKYVLMAFLINPALLHKGTDELRMMQSEADADAGYLGRLLADAKSKLVEEVTSMTSGMNVARFVGSESTSSMARTLVPPRAEDYLDASDDDDDDDALAHLNKKPRFLENAKPDDGPEKTDAELVQEEVQKLSKFQLNWDIALQQYSLVEQDQIDWRAVHRGDSLYLSKIFDVAQWWATRGKIQFPLVALVAPRILARPSSNAYHERIFSSCTYFDTKLRNRLGPERFEMAVLLTVNRVWMEEMLQAEPLSKEGIDEAAEEVLKFFGIDNVDDLVQDDEDNGVVFDLTSDVEDLNLNNDDEDDDEDN